MWTSGNSLKRELMRIVTKECKSMAWMKIVCSLFKCMKSNHHSSEVRMQVNSCWLSVPVRSTVLLWRRQTQKMSSVLMNLKSSLWNKKSFFQQSNSARDKEGLNIQISFFHQASLLSYCFGNYLFCGTSQMREHTHIEL